MNVQLVSELDDSSLVLHPTVNESEEDVEISSNAQLSNDILSITTPFSSSFPSLASIRDCWSGILIDSASSPSTVNTTYSNATRPSDAHLTNGEVRAFSFSPSSVLLLKNIIFKFVKKYKIFNSIYV